MLKTIIERVNRTYDYYTKRFECLTADSAAQKQSALDIRGAVFGEELKRGGLAGGNKAGLEDEFDAKSVQVLVWDKQNKAFAGTVRITPAPVYAGNTKYEKEYHLKAFPGRVLEHTVVVTRLAVLPKYRSTPAALLLAMKAYELGMNCLGTWIGIINCEPGLYPFYRSLGYRPLSRIFLSPFGGYRVPLYLVLHDYDYLKSVYSPFYQYAADHALPQKTEGLDWMYEYAGSGKTIQSGFDLIWPPSSGDYASRLTEGMSAKGKSQLLTRGVRIQCQPGDVVLGKGDGSKTLGFVSKGALEVRSGGKVLALIGQDDVFGEIAFVLGVPRTADVVAAVPETEIVLLSLNAVNRLTSTRDHVVFWKNLARILSGRLAGKVQ